MSANVARYAVLLALLVAGAGCSSGDEKRIPDYFGATTIPPLKVPEGLTEPQPARNMQLPEAAIKIQPPAPGDVEELQKPPRIIDDAAS